MRGAAATFQSYSNPSSPYFIRNGGSSGSGNANFNNVTMNNIIVNNSATITNTLTANTSTANILTANILTANALTVNNSISVSPNLSISALNTGACVFAMDNSNGQIYTHFVTKTTGGGLTAGHMQMFSYTNGIVTAQIYDIDPNGNVTFPTANTFVAIPNVVSNIWTGAAINIVPSTGLTLSLPAAKSGITPAATGLTPVAVPATGVTANCQILLTIQTPGGGVPGGAFVINKTAGVGFNMKGIDSGDASTYVYTIIDRP